LKSALYANTTNSAPFLSKWVSHWPEDFLWDNRRSEYKFWLVRCRDQQMDSDFRDSSLASWNGK